MIQSWFSPQRQIMHKARAVYRLQIERLEDRVVPSSWLVTSTSNSAATSGSLPWAVAQADADTSNADITFSSTAFSSATTITLTNTLTLSNTAYSITIDGSGAGPITISGNHAVQVINVNSGVTALIENVTVSEGYFFGSILDETGGTAVTNSGTLTLENCTLSANYASSGSACGTILNSGTATIENCLVTGNTCGNDSGDASGVDPSAPLVWFVL